MRFTGCAAAGSRHCGWTSARPPISSKKQSAMASDEALNDGPDAQHRAAHIRALADQLLQRWLGGDEFSHEQLSSWHPDLMPDLGDLMRLKIGIHRQVSL